MSDAFFRRDAATVVREGAACDGVDETKLAKLPRFVRYAVTGWLDCKPRLVAEIAEVAPRLVRLAATWAETPRNQDWRRVAAALDKAAVTDDDPTLRAFADVVRMVSMTVADVRAEPAEASRVLAALTAASDRYGQDFAADASVLCTLEWLSIGWLSLVAGDLQRWSTVSSLAHGQARAVGKEMTRRTRNLLEERAIEKDQRRADADAAKEAGQDAAVEPDVPEGHVLVCPTLNLKSNTKLRDAAKGHEHVVGKPLPLAPVPDVAHIRRALAAEFPYAVDAVDALLRPLVGRATVWFPPVLLVGAPGAGKSRLARRLAEALGVGVWRTDGAGAGGSAIAGLERRWYSAEPAHPLLAISRERIANPVLIIEEVDKAPTRQDYGRLWDGLLGLLERENSCRYPDPCLQAHLDLSHVSYVATANSTSPLPSPLLDRFRVVEVPEPRPDDLAALVPSLLLEWAREQGLDPRWADPLGADEHVLLAGKWKGGSVRRLRLYLDVILRHRDRERRRH